MKMNKKILIKVLMQLGNGFFLIMPMVMLCMFILKAGNLSCITVTNKMYMMLGSLAIITYWIFKWREIEL
jgi:hypothetical protein